VKDGNNIMIVSIAVVAIANEDSWSWFLPHVRANINVLPVFAISNRDKGVLAMAVSHTFKEVPHFFCVHDLMDNFNACFKNRELKKAWGIYSKG
jgi:hypothetical protein